MTKLDSHLGLDLSAVKDHAIHRIEKVDERIWDYCTTLSLCCEQSHSRCIEASLNQTTKEATEEARQPVRVSKTSLEGCIYHSTLRSEDLVQVTVLLREVKDLACTLGVLYV